MMPNITRGGKMPGLIMYLAGPGRANEHTNPHIVAGSDHVAVMVDAGVELSRDDALDIARTLDQPRKAFGTKVTSPVKEWNEETGKRETVGRKDSHVWHCSLSLRADEGQLTDAGWEAIANEFATRMGFVDPDGAKSSRWVAIHHGASKNGNDHIHFVAQMVTEDGSKARTHNDFKRAQTICSALEKEHGLVITEGRETGQVLSAEKPGEKRRADREQAPWVEKIELRRRLRAALAGSKSEANFVARVYEAGVIIRPRFAEGRTNEVTGYSVALPAPEGSDRSPIFYAPSKLDKSLSLPKVRETLGPYANGDPQALGVWQEHHRSTRASSSPRMGAMDQGLRERVQEGRVTHADLARIFAAGSMKYEINKPGPLAQMSEAHAQVAMNPPAYGHMARQIDRAASKNASEGWNAILMQAAHLSRVMADTDFGGNRPQLAAASVALGAMIVAEAQTRLDEAAARGATRREAMATTHSQSRDGGTSAPGAGMSRQEAERMQSLLRTQRGQGPTPGRTQSRPPTEQPYRAPEHGRGQDEGRER
jgi:hypothetical protein